MPTTTPTVAPVLEALPTLSRQPQALRSAPGRPPVLPRDEAEQRAALLRAVSDPIRLQLLSIIRDSPGSEACVCDMTDAVEVSQPTVSHHLKVLTEAGLLTRERRGTWAWFSLVPDRFDELRGFFA
ncbi:MAG: metalloregulator ArsR/SmtB family transcription factor [Lapillicoccus sp.]